MLKGLVKGVCLLARLNAQAKNKKCEALYSNSHYQLIRFTREAKKGRMRYAGS
jgi:hypothetical protein